MNLFDSVGIFLDIAWIFDCIMSLILSFKNYFGAGCVVAKRGALISNSVFRGDAPETRLIRIDATS